MSTFDIRTTEHSDPAVFDPPDQPTDVTPTHPLDSHQAQEREAKLREWWHEVQTQSYENRAQQCVDADFYDGLQWADEDAEVLRERGQAPLVFNVIAQHIRWILGTERRTRVDFKVFGRGDEDVKAASVKTKLIRYTDDVNKAAYHRSKAFEDAVKTGLGWLESGIRSDPGDEPLYDRWESWRNMWLDPLSKELDISDARYLFRSKWTDLDIAKVMFADRASLIDESAVAHNLYNLTEDDDLNSGGAYSTSSGYPQISSGVHSVSDSFHVGMRRQRVRLLECWYREPRKVQVVRPHVDGRYPDAFNRDLMRLSGRQMDPNDASLSLLAQHGHLSVYDATRMQVRCAILCSKGLLQDMDSTYKHDAFPFTPIWGFRRDRDNQPYGAIRNMRDPQEDLNKRRSKALFLLSSNRVIADEDAVEDWDELEEQVARPDGIIKKLAGRELEIKDDTQLAREHVQLMIQDQQFLESTSGVTGENKGEVTSASSGTAINLRQTQGSVVTADLFDNLRHAIQLHGEKKLSLIEQFYDEAKIVRIVNEAGHPDYMPINMPGPKGITNDITRTQADFVVDTQDYRETTRIAMMEAMLNVLGQMDPEVQIQLLDLVVDMSDMPKKDEMARRIRELNGQIDPDSPNAEQARAGRDEEKSKEAALERRLKEAKAAADESRAAKTWSDATRSEAEAMAKANEIAQAIALNPGLAAAMDELFASFKEEATAASPNQSGSLMSNVPPPEPGITEPMPAPIDNNTTVQETTNV